MPIAIFANKTFQVSSRSINTFSEFQTGTDLKTESQDVAGKKPSTYILGPDLDTIGLSIPLNSAWGNKVLSEYESWKALCEAGKPYPFIIGGKPFGKNKWLLKSVSMEKAVHDTKGNLISASLNLQFNEYVRSGSSSNSSYVVKSDGAIVSKLAYTPTTAEKQELKRKNPNADIAKSKLSSAQGLGGGFTGGSSGGGGGSGGGGAVNNGGGGGAF